LSRIVAIPRKAPHRSEDHPARKKVKRLDEIAQTLRRGEVFPITRLTTIKGLCQDAGAAGAFALFRERGQHNRCEIRGF
jgi:hypothetical protein